MSTSKTIRLLPRRYKSGEQYYEVNFDVVIPEDCVLDYSSAHAPAGFYADIFDTKTGTSIARTGCYEKEESAFESAERIMEHLQEEYYFGFNTDPSKEE